MFLYSLKLWNWRKYPQSPEGNPGLEIFFNDGLNVIVGENDSGKTAIIDAIKVTLGTNSHDNIWVNDTDFSKESQTLKVECTFKNLTDFEEAFFFEWLTIVPNKSELRVVLEAELYEDVNKQKRIKRSIKAGPENLEMAIEDSVRQVLSATYLKPLRDASSELSPGKNSRVAQVVKSLKDFEDGSQTTEDILGKFSEAFENLRTILDAPVLSKIQSTIDSFFEENNKKIPTIHNKELTIAEILRRLEMNLGEVGTGLGSSNLLFMSVELLLLSENLVGPKLALIEEIEAHIHPQVQLRVIKHFEEDSKNSGMQYIFTSHSPLLAASINLENIIMIYNQRAFSMRQGETKLQSEDYEFLERFLDATKANLFFARGIIFVEGDAENLLLPAIAEAINLPLHRYGISIVNLGSIAFKRYSSIFLRNNSNYAMNFPVAIITDLDLKPVEYYASEPCYFKIPKTINEEIASKYQASPNPELEQAIFINLNVALTKIHSTYYNKDIPGIDKKKVKEELREYIVDSSLDNSIDYFDQTVMERREKLQLDYFHDIEATKVFLSSPWTLEHSIASSQLRTNLEDILLDCNYSRDDNKKEQRNSWSVDERVRATEVYKFLLEKEISKTIVAQQLAKWIIDNKQTAGEVIRKSIPLQYLVQAIEHVTGGVQNEH